MKIDIDRIKTFAIDNSINSEIHGLEHWERVERNGIILAEKTKANLNVVRCFAYLHDICRENDGSDIEPGVRATLFVKNHENTILAGLTETEKEQLYCACIHHTTALKTSDETVNTCFDADRLDLQRIGITPHPERMATETGSYYAANIDKFYQLCESNKNRDTPKINTGLEFSDVPIDIKEENKMIVYRFNLGAFSPFQSAQWGGFDKWDYGAKSVKTNNPEGIYAFPALKQTLAIVLQRFLFEIQGSMFFKEEIVILKLEIDKTQLNRDENWEISFPGCNILEKMSTSKYILSEYPEHHEIAYWYHAFKSSPSEFNKKMLDKMCRIIMP